ncbi:hypothetical protein DFH94DRAFT_746187, partial [Russula ochroleuca]
AARTSRRTTKQKQTRMNTDLGYISLMIWEKGISTSSSPVLKNSINLAMNSLWTLCVSLCFSLAFSSVTLLHSAGGLLMCRLRESLRAKKSPHRSQKVIFSGCVSVVSQCRLKSCHVLNVASGQRRHLISRIEPRAQSGWVAASSALYPGLNFLGNWKYSFSASSCCCCCCCCCCGTGSCCT